MLKHLPNALTLLRLLLAPVVAACLLWGALQLVVQDPDTIATGRNPWLLTAAILFAVAALSDLLDGMAARAFGAESHFGRLIDPIADKALVGLPLLAYALLGFLLLGVGPLSLFILACVMVIIVRDVGMTLIRLGASDREGPRVTGMAKIKTAIEMLTVGYWLALHVLAPAFAPGLAASGLVWIGLLAVSAGLSAWTGWRYVRG